MYYDNEFVDTLVARVKIAEGEYAEYTARSAAKMLDKNPLWYRLFGVYWWAVKDALREHIKGPKRWYCGSYDDPLMKERAYHGSVFRTLVAGNYYMSAHNELSEAHIWHDKTGGARTYLLADHDLSA